MYHRVAELDVDPWGLAVSPANFSDQLAWLRTHRTIMSLAEFVARLERGDLPHNAAALTFDDGYADNLLNALPALAKQGASATLFLATGQHANRAPFWWDELARLVLLCEAAVNARILIAGVEHEVRWEDAPLEEHRHWRAWEAPRDEREAAYAALWASLQRISKPDRDDVMRQLRELVGPADCSTDLPMNRDELSIFVASGIFDIGAHSISHPALTALSPTESRHEIVGSQDQCEAITGRPVRGFAYPYGDLNERVRADVIAAGFSWACSTRNDVIRSASEDRFALPRIAVGDWNGEALGCALAVKR